MHSAERRKQKTMDQQMKRFLCVLLLVLAVYTAGSMLILGRVRHQTLRDMDEMSELYMRELDSRFLRISRSLFSTIMERRQADSAFWKYVNMIREEENIEYPVSKLREMYLSSVWEYGQEYQMFLYLGEADAYWHLTLSQEDGHRAPAEVQMAMTEQVRVLQDYSYSVKKKWNIVTCGGETYMCKIAQTDGVSLGCYVNVKSILEPFSSMTVGKNGYVRLVDEGGQTVGMLTGGKFLDKSTEESVGEPSICKLLSQAPFEIQMRVSGERMMELMLGSVIVLCVIASTLIGVSAFMLWWLKRNLLAPVQQFVENLENYDEGDYKFALTETNLLELEQIDDKFKHMIKQIRRLKITLYEQELEKQKVEMDYLKLQIRPHFYLNCLNFIYSMIGFGKYDGAKQMSRIAAEYLSYIFRNVHELVPVTAEATHCQNYLKILLLRHPDNFEYYVEIQEEVTDALIFPFLIQVFVENAAKHALTLSERTLISVTVYPEDREDEKYVNIYISDTGRGFPQDILQGLQRGENISKGGEHVGIENCMKRFYYYYQDKGEIHFENSPLGGAIVDIHIPYQKGENYESFAG